MAPESIAAVLDVPRAQGRRTEGASVLLDYWKLTKPEINFLIAITSASGFWMATTTAPSDFPWMRLLHTLLGTALAGGGAATLNQLIELPYDARMRRTARRPLAVAQ